MRRLAVVPVAEVQAAFASVGLPLRRTASGLYGVSALASRRHVGSGYDLLVFVFRSHDDALALVHKQSNEWRYSHSRVELVGNVIVLVFPRGQRPGVAGPVTPTPPRVARALARLRR
jgi:hypothetical protein